MRGKGIPVHSMKAQGGVLLVIPSALFYIRFMALQREQGSCHTDVACCRSEEEGADDPPVEEPDDHLGLGLGAEGMCVLLMLCN